jgi:hypothetical protein
LLKWVPGKDILQPVTPEGALNEISHASKARSCRLRLPMLLLLLLLLLLPPVNRWEMQSDRWLVKIEEGNGHL